MRAFKTAARNWEAFGESDAFFGVLSDPTKYGSRWDPDEFFASGRAHVEKLFRTLSDACIPLQTGTCLDFGCGPGRLTVPLSASFERTVGVDVARPMIEAARRFKPAAASCEFVVNRHPDLRQFRAGTFDVVHSCLVLQHIPPDVSLCYIAEFFRVAKRGGLVVFQLPAVRYTEDQISAVHALPDSAFLADIRFIEPPSTLDAGAETTVGVSVTNRSDITWPHHIPAGRHICLGNHWMHEDGTPSAYDDGRTFLPNEVGPGERVEMALTVRAPAVAGRYLLEADLVQEKIAWFAGKGSSPAREFVRVTDASPVVLGTTARTAEKSSPKSPAGTTGQASVSAAGWPMPGASSPPRSAQRWASLWKWFVRRVRGGTPTFEMHVVPRVQVAEVIRASEGILLKTVDDNAAGPGWLSYTYVCRKK